MSFFDTTPSGRIVNRFAKDMDAIDSEAPENFGDWLICLCEVVGTFIVISMQTPLFLSAMVLIFLIYMAIQRAYIASSRQLKRLESVSRSPMYSHFEETLSGVSTIRAFSSQSREESKFREKVDTFSCCCYTNLMANRWLCVRLEFCGNLAILAAAIFATLGCDGLTGGEAGVSISYAIDISLTLNWLVRYSSMLEMNFVSVERILEYCELPSEADWFV